MTVSCCLGREEGEAAKFTAPSCLRGAPRESQTQAADQISGRREKAPAGLQPHGRRQVSLSAAGGVWTRPANAGLLPAGQAAHPPCPAPTKQAGNTPQSLQDVKVW